VRRDASPPQQVLHTAQENAPQKLQALNQSLSWRSACMPSFASKRETVQANPSVQATAPAQGNAPASPGQMPPNESLSRSGSAAGARRESRESATPFTSVCRTCGHLDLWGAGSSPEQGPVLPRSVKEADVIGSHLSISLMHLIDCEGYQPDDIIILTPRTLRESCLRYVELKHDLSLVNHECTGIRAIHATSIEDFKGRERKVVILVEIDNYYLERKHKSSTAYIAISRPSEHLVVIGTEAGIDGLLDFPEMSEEDRRLNRQISGLKTLVRRVYGTSIGPEDLLRQRGFDNDAINWLVEHPGELMQNFVSQLKNQLDDSDRLIQRYGLNGTQPILDCSPERHVGTDRHTGKDKDKATDNEQKVLFAAVNSALAEAAADTLWSLSESMGR
jgi:hypothetical protein